MASCALDVAVQRSADGFQQYDDLPRLGMIVPKGLLCDPPRPLGGFTGRVELPFLLQDQRQILQRVCQ